jgi:hypothetical protein
MTNTWLGPPVIAAAVLAVGVVGAGALVGRGVIDARTGDRGVTVRGLSERGVKADLAVLPLRFAAVRVVTTVTYRLR